MEKNKNSALEALDAALNEVFGKRLVEYTTKCRRRDLADIRHIAMSILYTSAKFTEVELGEVFNRDHSSVSHAIRKVEDMRRYEDFNNDYQELLRIYELYANN